MKEKIKKKGFSLLHSHEMGHASDHTYTHRHMHVHTWVVCSAVHITLFIKDFRRSIWSL